MDELLVDPGALKVRYLAADVDEDELDLDDRDRRLMIPVRSVELNDDDEQVVVRGLESSRIRDFSGRVDLGEQSFATPVTGDRTVGEGRHGERLDTRDRDFAEREDLREREDVTEREDVRDRDDPGKRGGLRGREGEVRVPRAAAGGPGAALRPSWARRSCTCR